MPDIKRLSKNFFQMDYLLIFRLFLGKFSAFNRSRCPHRSLFKLQNLLKNTYKNLLEKILDNLEIKVTI